MAPRVSYVVGRLPTSRVSRQWSEQLFGSLSAVCRVAAGAQLTQAHPWEVAEVLDVS